MKYVRLCSGVRDRGILLPEEEVLNKINDQDDFYQSIYYYNENHYKQFEQTGSVKGIRDVLTNKLVFDFDCEANPDLARDDGKVVVARLSTMGIPAEDIQFYFSGNKGFNLVVESDQYLTPEQAGGLALKYAGDLNTFDTSLYDATQILRIPGTKHQKSGFYKIPLTTGQFNNWTLTRIQEQAKDLRNITDDFFSTVSTPKPEFFDIPKKKEAQKTAEYTLDLSKKTTGWRNCKFSLLQGNFKPGERHEALIRLAATCRGFGYDKEATYYLCKSALKKQAILNDQEEFPKDELWLNIIEESVFADGWEGGQYSCKSDPWLKNYCTGLGEFKCKEEAENQPLIKIHDIEQSFTDFVLHLGENTVKTGIKRLDDALPLTIGMNLGIVGAPSSGKTALALDILKNTSKENVTSVFASLDMHKNRLFEKLLYNVSNGKTRADIYNMFNTGNQAPLIQKIKDDYKNVYFYDRSCPTVKDIRAYIESINTNSGKKVKLVMLDYFERVNSERSDDTAASKDIAGQLQDLVNDYNICLITLVQPNKMSLGGGPETPILSYTAIKGSSFMYQSFRSIISIWRPFLTPKTKEKDKFLQMAILKNDLGELDTFDFGFEGKTGKIYELSEEQYYQFNNYMKEREAQKASKNNDWE